MTPPIPDPVEIAAGAWQLLPITGGDREEVAAYRSSDTLVAHFDRVLLAVEDGAALAWTVRTAVGGFVVGLVSARPGSTALEVSADIEPDAERTALGAVERYLVACGAEVLLLTD